MIIGMSGFAQVKTPPGWYHTNRKGAGMFRTILSKFTLEIGPGVGKKYYTHRLDGFSALQTANTDSVYLFLSQNISGSTVTPTLANWFSTTTSRSNIDLTGANVQLAENISKLKGKASGISIPLSTALYFKFDKFKIGGGALFDFSTVGKFSVYADKNELSSYTPEIRTVFFKTYYGMLGVNAYRYMDYMLSFDARIGTWRTGKKFNLPLIKRGVSYNFGTTVERSLSEYLNLYVRTGFDLKRYDLTIPETNSIIRHKINSLQVNFGINVRLPELKRCVLKDCHVQIDHPHGDREYRSRMHPIYKKQNPNYGENYPVLIKYKRKNKKKLNPY